MVTVLETRRLRLQELVPGDLDFLVELLGNREVMRFYATTLDRRGVERWLRRQWDRYARDGHGFWAVEHRGTGALVGQVGLLDQTLDDGVHSEIAYLVHVPHQRRGYGTEAAMAVRDHAFDVLRKSYVVSFVRPENIPSQKVAWRLGMRPEGMIRWADLDHLLFRVDREAG